jgi:peptidoglycan/LPS O-acetylase OafA/YrhL
VSGPPTAGWDGRAVRAVADDHAARAYPAAVDAAPTAPPAAEGRYLELDGLRGVAVSAVVVRHLTSTYDHFAPDAPAAPFAFEDGRYGVQLFFLISGFVILMTARRAGRPTPFVIARFTRLYPAYWVCLTVTVTVVALLGPDVLRRTAAQIAANTTMLQAALGVPHVDDSYWSLSVELLFYAVVTLALWRGWTGDRDILRVLGAWLALALVVAATYALAGRPDALWRVVILTGAEFPALFTTGVLALRSRGRALDPRVWGVLVVGFLLAWWCVDVRHAVVVTLVSLGFLLVTRVPGIPLLRSRWLRYLGAISFPLYLVHQFVGYSLVHALTPLVGRVLAMVLAAAVVVAVADVVHRTVETRGSAALRRRLTDAWRGRASVPPPEPT